MKFMVEFFSPKQCKRHLAVKSVFFTLELESLGMSRRGWPRLQKGSATSPERSAWGDSLLKVKRNIEITVLSSCSFKGV